MLKLDSIVPVDGRLITLTKGGGVAKSREAAGSGLDAKERVERLQQRLAGARDTHLAGEIIAGAKLALEKAGNPGAQYTYREALGLEAVVQTTDRPSLNVQDGFVNLDSVGSEQFDFRLRRMQDRIRDVIAAVGRIGVPNGASHIGTAIHIAEGLVATNRHVLEEIADQSADNSWSLRWPGKTTVDFAGEADRPSEAGFKVVEVCFKGPDPIKGHINFKHLDLAILRIEPIKDAELPRIVMLDGKADELVPERWVYTIGFPGRPKIWAEESVPRPGYELASVIEATFNDDFGCKKFAPGRVLHAPGTLKGDEATNWVFAHDCSTLRGNSGSAVVEFTRDGGRVLGIHFGGFARSSNWGHAFSALRETMTQIGATFSK